MTREEFEKLISEVLESLPVEFSKNLENVAVVVEDWPTDEDLRSVGIGKSTTLFGLYRGVPKIRRTNYYGVLPDKIIIFAGPILSHYGKNLHELRYQIRNTVLHEIGHHFGMTDEEIQKAQRR